MDHSADPTVTVWARTTFVGWHQWPDAPPHRNYLSTPHRHLFHVNASVEVRHDNREVEFHDLGDVVRAVIAGYPVTDQHGPGAVGHVVNLGHRSCEMVARDIRARIQATWPHRFVIVSVSEDDECGATVSWK